MKYTCTKCGAVYANRGNAAQCHPNVVVEGSIEDTEASISRVRHEAISESHKALINHIQAILAHLLNHNDRISKIEDKLNQ